MYSLDTEETKIEVLRLINNSVSYREIGRRLGISDSTICRFANKLTHKKWWSKNSKPIASGELLDHHNNINKSTKKRFIITSAQNNTFVHSNFLDSLETMADSIDAQIIVGTFSYNLNGFQNLQKGEKDWFDPRIEEYILDEPLQLADGLLWCGELNVLPTATNPLSGLHSYTRSDSGIVPHAKLQLESLPGHKEDGCRMMYTTGSITKRNYIQKKAGQKASFHHVFGALLVEVDKEGDWFVRQLITDEKTGEFYDLTKLYTPTEVIECDDNVEALNWGDIHVEKLDKDVFNASFDDKPHSILNTLRPKYQFVHDVIDFEARNHHNIKDPYFRFVAHKNKRDSVKDNVNKVAGFLYYLLRSYSEVVVVESNHDLAFKKWLKEADYKQDPENAIFYLENQLKVYQELEKGNSSFNVLEYATNKLYPELEHVNFLKVDESFKICDSESNGIECGSHGHIGNNGGRSSIRSFQVLGSKYNLGHSHSAAIKDGVYYAGVSGKLDMGYNQGGSSWSQSHIVTYRNGKRSIITIKNGKWRAVC